MVKAEFAPPAHAFLRLNTPEKLYSPTSGTARFGKITRVNEENPALINRFITKVRLTDIYSSIETTNFYSYRKLCN